MTPRPVPETARPEHTERRLPQTLRRGYELGGEAVDPVLQLAGRARRFGVEVGEGIEAARQQPPGGRAVAPGEGGAHQHGVGVLGPLVDGQGPVGDALCLLDVAPAQQQLGARQCRSAPRRHLAEPP
jgi:hypothetical protein